MSKILVCGLVNVETTVSIDSFPLEYCPIDYSFFGINSYPAGVALNIALALNTLSDTVKLLSMIGNDSAGKVVRSVLSEHNIDDDYLCETSHTAQSVVLFDKDGRRRIFCDLKDFQDRSYDESVFKKAVADTDVLCLCNINFSRNLLSVAKSMGKTIATDVHVLSDIDDDYNRDFLEHADILFLSNENISGCEQEFIEKLKNKYDCKIIVCGMGKNGALMYTRDTDSFYIEPACKVREIVNTVGAGDALFSSFVHFYAKGYSAKDCLKYATVFASYKIGDNGAAKGFINESDLLLLSEKIKE